MKMIYKKRKLKSLKTYSLFLNVIFNLISYIILNYIIIIILNIYYRVLPHPLEGLARHYIMCSLI